LILNDEHHQVLQELFHSTRNGDFLTMGELETMTGFSGYDLRNLIEDLKLSIYVVEHYEGFQVAPEGLHYCQSRWG
jgi:hypothetical protein